MSVVMAIGRTGPASFACGSADQALVKADELTDRGFKELRIIDPNDKEGTASALERSL